MTFVVLPFAPTANVWSTAAFVLLKAIVTDALVSENSEVESAGPSVTVAVSCAATPLFVRTIAPLAVAVTNVFVPSPKLSDRFETAM